MIINTLFVILVLLLSSTAWGERVLTLLEPAGGEAHLYRDHGDMPPPAINC